MSGGEVSEKFAGCRAFDAELAAHLEGEYRPDVTAHAAECVSCSNLLADLEQIRTASAELVPEEPPARLWANIRASLLAEGLIYERRSLLERWLVQVRALRRPLPAAALVGLTLVTVTLLRSPLITRLPSGVNSGVVTSLVTASTMFPSQTLAEMENTYHEREAVLDPEVKATYQRSLEFLNQQIKECQQSVEQEPKDSLAQEYLMTAYEQKAHVLESALEIAEQ